MSTAEPGARWPRVGEEETERARAALEKVWAEPRGMVGWLTNVNHTAIGRRYVVTALDRANLRPRCARRSTSC